MSISKENIPFMPLAVKPEFSIKLCFRKKNGDFVLINDNGINSIIRKLLDTSLAL